MLFLIEYIYITGGLWKNRFSFNALLKLEQMKKFIYVFFGIFVLGFMSPAFVYAETTDIDFDINMLGKGTKTPPPTCESAVRTAAHIKYAGHTPKSRTGTNDWATAVYQDTTPTDKYGDVETYIEYLLTQICNSQKPVNNDKKKKNETPATEQNKDVEAAIKAFKDKTDDNIIGSEVAIKKDISVSGNKNLSAAYSAWKKKCQEKQQTVTNVKKWKSVDAGFQSGNKNKYYCQVDLCEDGYDPSKDKKSCISKDTTCTSMDKNIKTAHYDKPTKTCVIDKCQDDYEVKDNKCVSKKKLARQETRANNKLEKEYAADIKSLVDAFNTVVTKISSRCEADGGTIVDGKCVSDNESGNKNNAVSGDYTLFTPPSDNAVDKICKYERNKYLGSKNWEVRPSECNFSKKANCPQSLETNESDQCTEKQLKTITKEKCEECLDLFKKNKRCYKEATDWCNKNGAKHN